MARIVRLMFKAPDGLPLVGVRRCCLGVRPHRDVDLDPPGDVSGNVISNHKGLSVSADWRTLEGHLIPRELDDGHNGADGKNMAVYVHGTGDFEECALNAGLEMIFKARTITEGVIRPVATVLLSEYQANLAATRPNWVIDAS